MKGKHSNWPYACYAEVEDDFQTFQFNMVKLCLHDQLLHHLYSFRALI